LEGFFLAVGLCLFAPYTAEEMWERLGHPPTVAKAGWPKADPALVVRAEVTCVVQVQGKVRAKLTVAPDVTDADLEHLALADANVQRAIGSQSVRKVIIKAPRVVNIVVG
jgi:leucyl-tRNA synthetase